MSREDGHPLAAQLVEGPLVVRLQSRLVAFRSSLDAGARASFATPDDLMAHLSFLAGAIEAESSRPFVDYTRWLGVLLEVRGLSATLLIDQFAALRDALAEVLPPDDALDVAAVIDDARVALLARATQRWPEPEPGWVETTYHEAVLGGRRSEAYATARMARGIGWSLERVYRELFIGTQRKVGDLWGGGALSVAQEHSCSAITQWVVARFYEGFPFSVATLGRALIGGIEGELHSLPAQFAADLLELSGWDVTFLGTDLAERALLTAVAQHQPDMVGLSVTLAANLPPTFAAVRALRAQTPTIRVVLGGQATRGQTEMAAELGFELEP